MQPGLIKEIAYKRSVLKKIKNKIEDINVGNNATEIKLEGVTSVRSSNCIIKWFEGFERLSVINCINGLMEKMATPKYLICSIIIPTDFDEKTLGKVTKNYNDVCEKLGITIAEYNVNVAEIEKPIANVTVIGDNPQFSPIKIEGGMDVVMAGTVAIGATAIMTINKKEELLNKFQQSFVNDCIEVGEYVKIDGMMKNLEGMNISRIHSVSQSGIFGAAWEIASNANLGITIDINKIPVWQQTIEVAEVFGYNPYIVDGNGAALIVTKDGEAIKEKLNQEGYYAEVIGQITETNDRIAINGDETRYLEPPRGDELYKFL